MFYLTILFFWFVLFGLVTSTVAKSKNLDPVAWFIIGGLLGLIGLIVVAVMPAGSATGAGRSAAGRACPYCGGKLNSSARQCPACGRGQPVTATTNQQAWEKLGEDDEVAKWARQHDSEKMILLTIVPDVPNWFTIPVLIVAVPVGLIVFIKVFEQFK